VQYDLGLAQLKEKKFEEAIGSLRKALELRPDWEDAYNNLGLAYAGAGRWKDAVTAYREALRIFPKYAGALYNLGIAHLRLGQNATAKEIAAQVKELNFDLQALLWQEILAVERPTNVVAAVPAPTPTPTAPAPPPEENQHPTNSVDEECPSPIYQRSGVTQMAFLKDQLQVSYTSEAAQNNVEGKIVLRLMVCSDGRVSDVTIDERLPFGLTERAIESIKKVRFQPALLGTQPVSVLTKQTFACAQQACTTVSP